MGFIGIIVILKMHAYVGEADYTQAARQMTDKLLLQVSAFKQTKF